MDIKDKVIIVTGASGGIGEAAAKVLAQKGAKVVVSARSAGKLEELAKQLPGAVAIAADMRKEDDIKNLYAKTLEKFGRIDAVINNAGQGLYGPVENINLQEYKDIMDLNVYGVLLSMQQAIPVMRKQGGGVILNISSRVSKNYFPGLAAYASTKYALNAISLTARTELEKDSIIVSVFHPKMTSTDFGKNAIGNRPNFANRPGPAPEVDTPGQVAEKVAEQLENGEAEAAM